MEQKIEIVKDAANKRLNITRRFNAPVEKVWQAWTEAHLLDKWWAPKPWRTETKQMDFKPGGVWLYSMVSPEGERHWCRVDFKTITPQTGFAADSAFCDEHGTINTGMPLMHWHNEFKATGSSSKVVVILTFDKEADMAKIIEMGFEGGFTMGLNNLEELLES